MSATTPNQLSEKWFSRRFFFPFGKHNIIIVSVVAPEMDHLSLAKNNLSPND